MARRKRKTLAQSRAILRAIRGNNMNAMLARETIKIDVELRRWKGPPQFQLLQEQIQDNHWERKI